MNEWMKTIAKTLIDHAGKAGESGLAFQNEEVARYIAREVWFIVTAAGDQTKYDITVRPNAARAGQWDVLLWRREEVPND